MAGKFAKETPSPIPFTYKKCEYEDIEKWCVENNQLEWLEKTMAKKSEHKIYPKKLNEYGKPIKYKGEDGKMHFVKDLDATPTVKAQPISFTKVKSLFFDKFFPDLKHDPKAKSNKAAAKESMHDRAARLAAEARAKAEAEAENTQE